MQKWYVAACRTNQEERAYQNLLRSNVTVYHPTVFTEFYQKGRRKVIESPLFPGYIFVNMDASINSVSTVNGTRGIKKIVAFGDFLAFVDDLVIETIIDQLSKNNKLLGPDLISGEEIEIQKGPFAKLKGIFIEKDGKTRSTMLINILGCKKPVSIPNEHL